MEKDIKIPNTLPFIDSSIILDQKINLEKYIPNYQFINLKSRREKDDLWMREKIYLLEGAGAGLIPGMTLGTALCPGIGTAIGALIGLGIGLWGGQKIEETVNKLQIKYEIEYNINSKYQLFKYKFSTFSNNENVFCHLSKNFMKKPCYLPTSHFLYEKEILIDHLNKYKTCPATEKPASINDITEYGNIFFFFIYTSEVVLKQGSFLKYFDEEERPFMEQLHEDCQKNYCKFLARNNLK